MASAVRVQGRRDGPMSRVPPAAAALLLLALPSCSLAQSLCTAADTSRAHAPPSDYFGTPNAFMSCNTPASFYGQGMSGMPYKVEQAEPKTSDAAGITVQLKLTPQKGGADAFKAFVIKAAVGSFECLSKNTRFKNCTGVKMQADAPGGEGTHQAITQVDNADKTEATFTWRVPTGTKGILRLTVVVLEATDWYGASMAFSFDDAPASPKASTAAAAAGEITLATDFATFDAEVFNKELAAVLKVPAQRISVLEVRPGSVVVIFAIASAPSPAPTPAVLMKSLESQIANPASSVYSKALLKTTTANGLTVLSNGICTSTGGAVGEIKESCSRCKSAGMVLLMIGCAILAAGSTVFLCTMCKLRGRKSRKVMDAKWEKECDRCEAKSGAKVITCQELQQKVTDGDQVFIIDTRGSDEHAISTIKAGSNTAVLLEPKKVEGEMEWACGTDVKSFIQPPPDATIVCHCTAGYRSGFAANDLTKRLGREVLNLRGGIVSWANLRDGNQFDVVDPKTGKGGAPVHTYGAKWGAFLHTPENRLYYKNYVAADDTVTCSGLLKPFVAMSILMTVVLIFLLIDIPLAYEEFIEWIQNIGAWGPIVAGIAWIPVCLLFVPGLILSLSTGFAFDFAPAFCSVLVGATIGCCCATVAGRYIGREWVEGMVEAWPKFKAIDAAITQEGWKIVFLLRLSPLIPFNLLNYSLGLTDVPVFPDYFLATLIGMAPGTAMFVYIGTTLGAVADVLKGNVDGGGDCLNAAGDTQKGLSKEPCLTAGHVWEETDTSAMRLVLMIVGLVATVVATVVITVIAKKKLDSYVSPNTEQGTAKDAEADDKVLPPPPAAADPAGKKTAEVEQPIRLPPVAGWMTYGGCLLGWLLLIGALAGIVLIVLHKEKVDFTPADPGNSTIFVTAAALRKMMVDPALSVTILDARETNGDHIPGAQKADWKSFTPWTSSNRDSTLKSAAQLEVLLRAKGVSNDQQVVVYGDWANQGAWGEEGRLFWMLEYLNHTRVSVLYGGIDAYHRESPNGLGLELESDWKKPATAGDFAAFERVELRATRQEIHAAILLKLCNVVFFDTRTQAEFDGSRSMYSAERDGHIPNAKWFPWQQVFDSDGGNLKSRQALRAELLAYGVTDTSMIIGYCTGGIRSGFLYLVLRWAGFPTLQNYDGSWWEWSQKVYAMPIE